MKPHPPPAAPVFTWTGVYVGASVGGAWPHRAVTDNVTGLSFNTDNSGFIGGGQVGLQLNTFLLGVEWDIDGTTINHTSGTVTALLGLPGIGGDQFQASANMDWISTLTGRIGWL